MRLRPFLVRAVTAIVIGLMSASKGYCQGGAGGGAGGAGGAGGGGVAGTPGTAGSGGIGGLGTAGVGGAASSINSSVGGGGVGASGIGGGAHQGHILTGLGATGIPQNYFRGATPGMSLSPQESPSGALNNGRSRRRQEARTKGTLRSPRRRAGGGRAMGRGDGVTPKGGDENPAETLLDEINGSHNGNRTGHAALRPPPRYRRGARGLSSDPPSLTPRRIEERAVYFAERGAYEDMVYRPYRGSYRQPRRSSSASRNPRRY